MNAAAIPSTPDAVPPKEQTRQRFRSLRSQLSGEQHREAADSLARIGAPILDDLYHGEPGVVAAYLSVGAEPGTHVLLEKLVEAGYDVVVPVCERGYQLSWTHWRPDVELVPSDRSWVREPVGPRLEFQELPHVRLILVPALVLDRRGCRMGQGGGYYDRFLAGVYARGQRPATVGVVHTHEVVEPGTFECDPHDMPLDGVLTPAEFSWFTR